MNRSAVDRRSDGIDGHLRHYVYQNATNTIRLDTQAPALMVSSITMGLIMLRVFQVDKQLRVPRMDI